MTKCHFSSLRPPPANLKGSDSCLTSSHNVPRMKHCARQTYMTWNNAHECLRMGIAILLLGFRQSISEFHIYSPVSLGAISSLAWWQETLTLLNMRTLLCIHIQTYTHRFTFPGSCRCRLTHTHSLSLLPVWGSWGDSNSLEPLFP